MNENYIPAEMQIIYFDTQDVVTISNPSVSTDGLPVKKIDA